MCALSQQKQELSPRSLGPMKTLRKLPSSNPDVAALANGAISVFGVPEVERELNVDQRQTRGAFPCVRVRAFISVQNTISYPNTFHSCARIIPGGPYLPCKDVSSFVTFLTMLPDIFPMPDQALRQLDGSSPETSRE